MREYMLDSFNWGITAVNRSYQFPDYIITNTALWPNLLQLLAMFRYYRTDLEIRVKMETTPFHQGSLMIGSLPGGAGVGPSLTTLSGLNSFVLCSSLQNECKFVMPFLSPRNWIDSTENTSPDASIGSLFIKTLNTLIPTQANMPSSVPVLVYFRFVNMKQMSPVSGPIPHPSLRTIKAIAHMSVKHNKEASSKSKNGVDSSSIVSSISSLIKEAPVVGGIYSTAVGVLKSIAPDLSKPLSQEAACNLQSFYGGQTATTKGLQYAVETSMYPNALVTQSPEFYGMQSSHMGVSSLAQRPMLHNAVTLSNASPEYQTLATPLFTQTFGNTTVTPGPLATSDWLYNVAYAFRYWRGSIKYLLHFCVPSFYAFRVRITVEDQNGTSVTQTGDIISKIIDVKGDTMVELSVPYIRSTSWVSPRSDINPPLPFGGYLPPLISVFILTPIVGSTAPTTPVVYLNIWRSGGEDTQFASLQGARDGQDTINADAHMDITTIFKKPFDALLPTQTQATEEGLIQADVAGSVSDCLKRESNHVPFTSGTTRVTFPGQFAPGTASANFFNVGREPFHYFANMFLFWRGSRILKHYQSYPDFVSLQGPDSVAMHGDGGANLFLTTSTYPSIMHAEAISVPYSACVPYYATWTGLQVLSSSLLQSASQFFTPLDLRSGSVGSVQSGLTLSGGDDFMCLHPVPFFPLVTYPRTADDAKSSQTPSKVPKTSSKINRQIVTHRAPGDNNTAENHTS